MLPNRTLLQHTLNKLPFMHQWPVFYNTGAIALSGIHQIAIKTLNMYLFGYLAVEHCL